MAKTHQKQKVVIVGGGFGGVKLALELKDHQVFDVQLISNTTNFEYHGALYRTATGNSPTEVIIPLRELFKDAKNVEVILDTINRINPEAHSIKGVDGTIYSYDVLVLALGNQINYFGLEGMDEKTFNINSIGRTIALRHELVARFKSGKETSVTVIGGGPTGVELAGEILHFADRVAEKYKKKVQPPKVRIIEGADRLLAMFDPVLSAKVYKRLKALNVEVLLSTKVNSCEEGKVCLSSGDIDSDIIVWTAGSKIAPFYETNAQYFTLERGKIAVDNHLRAKGHHNIFIIGDNAATPYAGMAQTALNDAEYLAENLLRQHRGSKLVPYNPKKPVYVVPVGINWAVYQSDKHQISGYKGWLLRRQADLAIYKKFKPYKQAIKHWRRGNSLAKF